MNNRTPLDISDPDDFVNSFFEKRKTPAQVKAHADAEKTLLKHMLIAIQKIDSNPFDVN